MKQRIAQEKDPRIYQLLRGLSYCTPGGIRTPNLLIRSQMLYPLSYGRMGQFSVITRLRMWRRREDLNLRSPEGQLISSESHSAALARLQNLLNEGTGPFEPPSSKATVGINQSAKQLVIQRRWLSNQSKMRVCASTSSASSSSSLPGLSARCN